jgi:hypothetical protein
LAWPLLSSDTDTPLFLEIRADLAKSARNRRTPQREVAILAKKVRGYAASVNIDHYNMSVAELLGNRVEMRCRPLIGGARKVTTSDGRCGYFFDEPPEIRSLRHWTEGNFSDEDWKFARLWRESIAQSDLSEVQRAFGWIKDSGRDLTTLEGILNLIDQTFGNAKLQHGLLQHLVDIMPVPKSIRLNVLSRWKQTGRPMVGIYAPYATHVARLDFFCGTGARVNRCTQSAPD